MTDWTAVARARGLDIPSDAVGSISGSLDALEEAFRPLLTKLSLEIEPAVILSEAAVTGK